MSFATIELINGKVPSMSGIIRPLGVSEAKSDIVDQVVIRYNRSKSQIEKLDGRRVPMRTVLGLDQGSEFFLIDVYHGTQLDFIMQYRVKHQEYGSVDIPLHFKLRAKGGGEIDMARELLRRDTPSSLLTDKINLWVIKSIDDHIIKLYNNIDSFSDAITRYMAQQAAIIGILLDVRVNISREIIKESIISSGKQVRIQPKGYNNFLELGFEAVLVPDEHLRNGMLTSVGQKNRGEFQQLLVLWLQEYIRIEVNYNEITSLLHSKVRAGIIDYWNRLLRANNKGWLVSELVLHSTDVPAENFKFERMEINVELRNARIPMINTIILNLEDAELFKNSRIENLETWIREKLQQSTQNVLAKVVYAELVSRIDQLRGIIKSDLDKQAQRIGYRVEYLLTSELVDKARLNFKFELEKGEQSFQTTLHDTVNLNVMVDGRIKSLDYDFWLNNLTPETDFVYEMKKEVMKDVRQLLLRTNANEFYTKFAVSVEPLLVSSLKNMLVSQFNVDIGIDIFLKIEPSPISILIRTLQRGQHTIAVGLFGDAVVFEITFSVLGVVPDQWELFASRSNDTADEVIKLIGERISIFIANMVGLKSMDINDLLDKRLFTEIFRIAEKSNTVIRQKMGLMIEVIDVKQIKNKISGDFISHSLESGQKKMMRSLNALQKIDEQIDEAYLNGDFEWAEKLETDKKRIQSRFEKNGYEAYDLPEHKSTKMFEEGNVDNINGRSEENGDVTSNQQSVED